MYPSIRMWNIRRKFAFSRSKVSHSRIADDRFEEVQKVIIKHFNYTHCKIQQPPLRIQQQVWQPSITWTGTTTNFITVLPQMIEPYHQDKNKKKKNKKNKEQILSIEHNIHYLRWKVDSDWCGVSFFFHNHDAGKGDNKA